MIGEFLAQKRIAVVGVSRNPSDYSRMLFREFRKRGYDAVPVTPQAEEIEGVRSFARVQDITPGVDAALVLTAPRITGAIVRDCADAGIARVWLRKDVQGAAGFCRSRGIAVIAGQCPFMFLPGAGGVHRLHGFLLKIVGRYPA